MGEALIPVSRLPQNEPVEQWYGLQPPAGSGMTFTKAALLLRFLFTTASSPPAAAAAAAANARGGSAATGGTVTPGGSGTPPSQGASGGTAPAGQGFSRRGGVSGKGTGSDVESAGVKGDRPNAVGVGGDEARVEEEARSGVPAGGGAAADQGGGDDATDGSEESVDGKGDGGGNRDGEKAQNTALSKARDENDELVPDPNLDPYGSEIDEEDAVRLQNLLLGDEFGTARGHLQLGKWGGTTGTLHAVST